MSKYDDNGHFRATNCDLPGTHSIVLTSYTSFTKIH